jgi:hypothetical protein
VTDQSAHPAPPAVPAAVVERGLALGLLALDDALALAAAASPAATVLQHAASPRVEYYAAILDGASLAAGRRAALEAAALAAARHGRRRGNRPPGLDFASLALLLPRLTGARRAEAGALALAHALPKAAWRNLLLARIAPALTPAELERALAAVIGPEAGAEAVDAAWEDEPDADTEVSDFAEVMALIPHLSGPARRRALVTALRRAGRIGHNSEFRGRDLGPRQAALAELAPYLIDDDLRALARRIARGSGFAPPPELDWPAERVRREQPLVTRRAFLAAERCRRWLGWDDRTIAGILADLPAAERDALVAEALDCLGRHPFGHDGAAFLSRGLRAAARFLARPRVAELLRRYGSGRPSP